MMSRWEQELCDKQFREDNPRKSWVVCVVNQDNGGLYPIAAFSSQELAAAYIVRQSSIVKDLPWFKDIAKFRMMDFVVDSNTVKEEGQ